MKKDLVVTSEPKLAASPEVRLTRIRQIPTIEIMMSELRQIEDSASDEKTALAFWTGFAGALISAVLGIPAADASPARWAIFAALTAVCAAGCLWFFVTWLRKRKQCARILEEIRARAGVVQHTTLLTATEPAPADDASDASSGGAG